MRPWNGVHDYADGRRSDVKGRSPTDLRYTNAPNAAGELARTRPFARSPARRSLTDSPPSSAPCAMNTHRVPPPLSCSTDGRRRPTTAAGLRVVGVSVRSNNPERRATAVPNRSARVCERSQPKTDPHRAVGYSGPGGLRGGILLVTTRPAPGLVPTVAHCPCRSCTRGPEPLSLLIRSKRGIVRQCPQPLLASELARNPEAGTIGSGISRSVAKLVEPLEDLCPAVQERLFRAVSQIDSVELVEGFPNGGVVRVLSVVGDPLPGPPLCLVACHSAVQQSFEDGDNLVAAGNLRHDPSMHDACLQGGPPRRRDRTCSVEGFASWPPGYKSFGGGCASWDDQAEPLSAWAGASRWFPRFPQIS